MNTRKILKSAQGKIRWECEHCSTPISCSVEHAGAESQCPHCSNPTTFPTLEEVPNSDLGAVRMKKSDLLASLGFSYFISVWGHVSAQKDLLFFSNFSNTNRIIQFFSGAFGITIRCAILSWVVCLGISMMRKRKPHDTKTFPWRKFPTILVIVSLVDLFIFQYLRQQGYM